MTTLGAAGYRIRAVQARQVLDSRAAPTVEADVILHNGLIGRAAVPSGASTGAHEALELRDSANSLWAGRGVLTAVANVTTHLAPVVIGLDARDQRAVDAALQAADPTPGYSRLGANAVLAVSLATARAGALATDRQLFEHIADLQGTPSTLPLPMVNMISGGAHAGRNLDIQDVLAIPIGAATYTSGLEMIVRVYWALRQILIDVGHPPLVGDEGGFGPRLSSNEESLALVTQAIERAGLRPGDDVSLALDVAATEFYTDAGYHLAHANNDPHNGPHTYDSAGMTALIEEWATRYPLVSVEDPLAEDDWSGWKNLTHRLGSRLQLVGDDLFVTNVKRLEQGIGQGVANAILVKVNQIGTLSEALDALRMATIAGYRTVVSARSGETEDDWLADLATGTNGGQIKVGSVARSERLAKYNRLLRIEELLGGSGAPYTRGLF